MYAVVYVYTHVYVYVYIYVYIYIYVYVCMYVCMYTAKILGTYMNCIELLFQSHGREDIGIKPAPSLSEVYLYVQTYERVHTWRGSSSFRTNKQLAW